MPPPSDPTPINGATVTLRVATTSDARLLAQLGARLFEQTFGAANEPADMRAYLAEAFTIEGLSAELADDATRWTVVAEDAGHAAIGYASIRRGPAPASVATGEAGDRAVELQRLYVDSIWHGRGAAQTLMAACREQARAWHGDVLWLGVWQRNPRAIAFYERQGFRAVGTQSFILGGDLQQDLVMASALG